MTRALAPLLAAAALVAAGCGGSENASSGPGAAADVVPANAAAFVAFATDREAEQVERVRELVEGFPGARGAVDEMLREALDGRSWQDVEPALGDELALVFVEGADEPVALTQPDDVAKLRELAQQEEGAQLEVREVEDGWHAIGEKAALDAFERARGGESLGGSDAYEDAFDGLETDVLARFYGRAEAINRMLPPLPGGSAPQSAGVGTVAGVVEALDGGLRVDGRMTDVEQEQALKQYDPALLGRVPDDAFLAASLGPMRDAANDIRKQGVPFVPELERGLGVTLDELVGVLGSESVLYVRAGVGIPEVTLAGTPESPQDAVATLRRLADAASGFTGGRLRTTTLDGVEVHVLQIQMVQLQFAAVDDHVVVTTGTTGLRDFRRDGDKLADSDRFEGALEEAGWDGGETAGLFWLDFQEALPIVEGLAGLAGQNVPQDLRSSLERLDTLAAASSVDDDDVRFTVVFRTR